MQLDVVVLGAVACVFAVVSGANDGGALLATGLKLPSVRPAAGILALTAALVLVPLASQRVALTFVTRLGGFGGPGGRQAMTIAVLSALVVVAVLSGSGRPTSLTLAVVGGLAGAGIGWGLPVSGGAVALVLAVALAAPFVGALVAWVVARLLGLATRRGLRRWHLAGFALQCVAYAANDGQKTLSVFMIALGVSRAPLSVTSAAAALFAAGTLYGLPRAGRTLSREIIVSRPLHGVAAELASGAAVVGCAAAGMPVSMTQAIAGALIGAGVSRGGGRVRWPAALRIVVAWALTLPAGGLLAGVVALAVRLAERGAGL
ncbi:anion permease [Streptosporangium sandarakinum]|uniref:PiT family inorganic phosphate transporter n=1 Tax=Streptosporangium sandarakinum TaxID=1260955 RepID=A0A852UYS8_9ACTN|nr:inorganic phosphate transporter [Streptosporangium sandarakinum]NYF38971.1 PiT family inorganic phosphate transporter [Streptosporangium sandarakinum]